MIAKLQNLVKQHKQGLFLGLLLFLTAGVGYNIGQIWAVGHPQSSDVQAAAFKSLPGLQNGAQKAADPTIKPTPVDLRVVASKAAGSKLYHHPWCSGAKRIKLENQLWFPTEADAISAGYTLAANCQ
jgi:hypothetical protein